MRLPKFRGKRVDNDEWVYGWYVKGECAYIITQETFYSAVVSLPDSVGYNHMSTFCQQVHPDTVGQYTGRKDDSEKFTEVYDGSKIKITIQDGEGIEEFQHHEYGTIVWSELDLAWCVTFTDDKFPELLSEYEEIEVIGTIHEEKP